MDEIVKRAIEKWPNVPVVYGWLSLDRRGRWLLRGEHIDNPAITAFIARNYEHDALGRWFFQNGPQRVFVDLEYTPIVVRLVDTATLGTHTGRLVSILDGAWIDEHGRMLVATEHGPALVDDRDIESLSAWITSLGAPMDDDRLIAAIEDLQRGGVPDLCVRYGTKVVPLRPIFAADVPARFGFVAEPRDGSCQTTSD